MAHRWRLMHRRRRGGKKSRPRSCEVCKSKDVLECRLYFWEDVHAYLCSDHAKDWGFCAGCGIFCSGMESFDFGRFPGFCDNCQDEIGSNYADETGEDDLYDYVDFEEVY